MIMSNISLNNKDRCNHFQPCHVFFGKKIVNKIIPNSLFTSITYSTPLCNFTNIFITITFKETSINSSFNTKLLFLDNACNVNIIESLRLIEYTILSNYIDNSNLNCNKKPIYIIANELSKNKIKLTTNFKNTSDVKLNYVIMLKISGVWENNNAYGLAYKYFAVLK